jgi:DNA-binding NtrC family response regulator
MVDEPAASSQPVASSQPAAGSPVKAPLRAPIIVVDDEPLIRSSLARAVSRSGLDVVTAADGLEALEKFKEQGTAAIFADVRMPGLDGIGLLKSIKARAPNTPVVLLTGFPSEALTEEARAAGAAEVLQKPVTYGDLQRILEDILRRSATTLERTTILTATPVMETALALARRVAQTEATVLIQGETGTGKELLARYIHRHSSRADRPLVAVNCAALPESLIESELFGHEKGAFTGAAARRTGRFEAADGGTLLLDEVTEIPLGLQAKLLRVLQEGEVTRVGNSHPVTVDVRVIAVTNRDMRSEVAAGRCREDLYYRLNVVTLRPPALRDRAGDIPVLARHFLLKYAALHGSPAQEFSPEAMDRLLAHHWPGNVRELENTVQRAVILTTIPRIGLDSVVIEEMSPAPIAIGGRTIGELKRDVILSTLERMNGNRTHAAQALGISSRTIRNHLRKYRLQAEGGAERAQD